MSYIKVRAPDVIKREIAMPYLVGMPSAWIPFIQFDDGSSYLTVILGAIG